MRIPCIYKYEYVACLPSYVENAIIKEVKAALSTAALTDNERENALMDAEVSKVCDLTDTITIAFV